MFHVVDEGPVRWLTLDNPGRRNAVPTDQWEVLTGHLDDFETSDLRALVVTGAGDDFCSGADLGTGFQGREMVHAYEAMARVGAAARALHRITKPTVAAVDGVAVGAGLNLALGCDLLIATDRARFAEIFVRRGLTVDFAGTWLLPRRIGLARAKELALTGRMFDAAEAERLGIVTRVVAPDGLRAAAAGAAGVLASGAPLAQRMIKAGFDRSFEMSFEEALSYEQAAQAMLMSSDDVVEGVAAFLQKRDPEFRGR